MMPVSRRRIIWSAVMVPILAVAGVVLYLAIRDPLYDPDFDTHVADPAYRTDRPRVLYDEGHRNAHKASGGYKPFVELIRNDGYDVQPSQEPFSAERLAGVSVVVIVLAMGENDANDAPALPESEITVVDQWVRAGGSLLLVTDHFPFGAASASLGLRFGVEIGNGIVEDSNHHEPIIGESHLIFSRVNGLLLDHPVTRGRNAAERVERVLTFTGTSLRGPAEAAAFMSLSDVAVDRPSSPPAVERSGGDVRVTVHYGDPVPARGRVQGLAMEVGQGRMVVLGEAGMLSAQLDPNGKPVGMNFRGYDNRQLALNIMHWLSRLL